MKLKFKSMTLPILLSTIAMVVVSVSFHGGMAFGQAVPLIPIQSGNSTLDKGLPIFYDCIDEKIDNSKGAEEDDYFEKEPTKNEVTSCYEETFLSGTNTSSSDDSDTSSSDDSDTSSSDDSKIHSSGYTSDPNDNVAKFNELFGY
jgi:hypothetical protein